MNRAVAIAYSDIGHMPQDHVQELQLRHTETVLQEVEQRTKARREETEKIERRLAALLRASLKLEFLHKEIFYRYDFQSFLQQSKNIPMV